MIIEREGFQLRPVETDGQVTEETLMAIFKVYRQCEDFLALGPVAQASLEMVRADLELSHQHGGVFYGIYDSLTGEMTGIVDFVAAGVEGDPRLADLSLLMIAAPYRGQGLGWVVVQAVEEAMRRAGAITVHSGVQVNNPVGIHFWQRQGYQIVSEATPMPDGTTCFALRKSLPVSPTC